MAIFRNMLGSSVSQNNPAVPENVQAAVITSADAKQFGFENFGNTCYINAILQALYFCPPFRELVISTPDASNLAKQQTESSILPTFKPPVPTPSKRRQTTTANGENTLPTAPPTLFSALRSLFIYIARNPNDKGKVSPTAFVNKVKAENEAFRNNNHQDAHEALNFILNKVMEDLEAEEQSMSQAANGKANTFAISSRSRRTLVHDLFEGTLTSETRCLTCETVSSRDESFLDLSIDIEPHSSVTACLRQFSASEMLCQRNKFSCDSCSGLQEAEKRMKVKKLPNILALHLKRFKYQEESQKFIKLTYRVAFPFELRLFNTVDDAENADRLYELFAIVVHIGSGPHHGHYTTIIRTQSSWFLYDDDNVDSIKESDIPKYFGESSVGAGYVLFYQAADMNYSRACLSEPNSGASSMHNVPSDDDDPPASSRLELRAPVESRTRTNSRSHTLPVDALSQRIGSSQAKPNRPSALASPDVSGGKTSPTVPLRRFSSEKNITAKSGPPPDHSTPPLPAIARRPKTGDDSLAGNRISWLTTLGRNHNKRPHEPPSSFNHSLSEHTNTPQVKQSHTHSHNTTSDTIPEEKTGPRFETNTKPINGTSKRSDLSRPDLSRSASIQSATPKATQSTKLVSLNPSVPVLSSLLTPPFASASPPLSSKGPVTQNKQNSIPAPRESPSPEIGLTHTPHSPSHNIMSPFKKAARKMSLSSMPMKFAGLSKK